MKFVRAATIEEVLCATPEDEATRSVVRAIPAFGVWSFDRKDIGDIGAQLPSGKSGAISSLLGGWKKWLGSPDPRVVWSADVYGAFVHLLRQGQSFSVRPIVLGSSPVIHDGRHRLFAAFEFLMEKESDRSFEVYWDRLP